MDIGDVWQNERYEIAVPVENRGPSPPSLVNAPSGCRTVTLAPKGVTLQPGERTSVTLAVDLSEFASTAVTTIPIAVSAEVRPGNPLRGCGFGCGLAVSRK